MAFRPNAVPNATRLQGPAVPRPRAQRQQRQLRRSAAEQRQTQRRGGLLPGAEALQAEVVGETCGGFHGDMCDG